MTLLSSHSINRNAKLLSEFRESSLTRGHVHSRAWRGMSWATRVSSGTILRVPTSPLIWVQPTVTFPIGDHVNVFYDYKKTGPSTILKLPSCRCHHLIDMLVEFCKNHMFLTLLKWLNVPYLSMFTNFCINYYRRKNCQKSFRLLKSSKIHGYTANMFYQQTCQCVCSNSVMSDDMIFF